MSGWSKQDQMLDEDCDTDFPAVNNITIAGYMPHDQIPAPGECSPILIFI